jgi:hypothetical protein
MRIHIFCSRVVSTATIGLVFITAAGCADHVQEAKLLSADVARYRLAQTERIERLNTDYRRTVERLNDELNALGEEELRQAFGLDALREADELVEHLETASLPGRFRDRFEVGAAVQRTKIEQVDASIAAARSAYADAYHEAKLELARLKTAEARVNALAVTRDERERLSELLGKVVQAYRQVREEEKKADDEAAADVGPTTANPGDHS